MQGVGTSPIPSEVERSKATCLGEGAHSRAGWGWLGGDAGALRREMVMPVKGSSVEEGSEARPWGE